MTLQPAVFVIALVFGFMLAEWRLSLQNEKALRMRGAVEPQGDVYRAMALVYPAAFLLMGIEGVWRSLMPSQVVAGAPPAPAWWVAGVLLMVASKTLKYWAIASLADRWTFKVLVLPGVPLVNRGPYRYVDHPNYIAVIGEMLAMMLMMSAWMTGPVMTLAFAVILVLRLRTETRALRDPRAR